MNAAIHYLQTHSVEITGAVLSLIYLAFSIRQHILLWFFGLLSSVFYIDVFFDAKLYADMSLQMYYVVVSIYGWIHWKYGNTKDGQHELPASFIRKKQAIATSLATLGIYALYYIVLKYFSDSPIPILDSFVGALSIVGTWMLAKKQIENWLVWIVVDTFCVGLYLWKGLYPTAALFTVYSVMAVAGYLEWKKKMQPKEN